MAIVLFSHEADSDYSHKRICCLLEFNMLGVDITALASRSLKTLVRTDVQAYYITLLSSNFNINHFVLHTKIFMINRT